MTKIFVIDDSMIDLEILCSLLQSNSFEASSFISGKDALKHIEKEKPDLVLLDYLMPELSGIEVLQEIRSRHSSFDLPVIMLTSISENDSIVEALKLGANDYISKPINFDIVSLRILSQLRLKELAAQQSIMEQVKIMAQMITTYNHEINNPLTVAIGNLTFLKREISCIRVEKIEKSLLRIQDIIKESQKCLDEKKFTIKEYSSGSTMFDFLKK